MIIRYLIPTIQRLKKVQRVKCLPSMRRLQTTSGIIDELTQIEINVGAVNQVVANINANMINYQHALNNINEQYYNINNIIPPPIYEYVEDAEEPTIMDGILAEEDARRDEAAYNPGSMGDTQTV